MRAIDSLCCTDGQHGEVVVLLGTVAELVGVSLEGLDHVAHTLRSVRRHQLDDTLLAYYVRALRQSPALKLLSKYSWIITILI